MKSYLKSGIVLFVMAMMLLISSCQRGSGCGAWSKKQYKKQNQTHTTQNVENFTGHKG